jgi:hypothetical protein
MADLTIKYKDNVIAEMDASGSKTLNTSGCYCEGDIQVAYTPRSRTYEITLPKSSGWVMLTELDEDVLAHITDDSFVVSMVNISTYEFASYSSGVFVVGNAKQGMQGDNPVYGIILREQSATSTSIGRCYRPAKNTSSELVSGEMLTLRLDGTKYYAKAGDGFIKGGEYRLTLSW